MATIDPLHTLQLLLPVQRPMRSEANWTAPGYQASSRRCLAFLLCNVPSVVGSFSSRMHWREISMQYDLSFQLINTCYYMITLYFCSGCC